MARHLVLGNQELLVNIDRWLQVRDIFFPHVGQYNHLVGHAHKIAILEKDAVSWINEESWEKKIRYAGTTLVTDSTAKNKHMGLTIRFNENVYCEDNIFFRKLTIKNHHPTQRKIRIAFHHDFHLYSDGIGDTAYYDPKLKAIIHYKRDTYFLLGVCDGKGNAAISDYTVGEHISPSWHMNKNPIAQGEVDSILSHDVTLPGNGSVSLTYYMAAATSFREVRLVQKKFLHTGVENHLKHTKLCQEGWLGPIRPDISILPKRLQDHYKRSLLIIKTQCNKNGAILAANDSSNMQYNKDTYSYLWPRDGALVSIALIKAGFAGLAKPFFTFCGDVLHQTGCLLHKYNPDKTLGSSWHPWVHKGKPSLPIQEDETALVLHALWKYYQHTHDKDFIKSLFPFLIEPMAQFLEQYRYENGLPKESYDLWEERRGIFTFTTSTVIGGLESASKLGDLIGKKGFAKQCGRSAREVKEAMLKRLVDPNNNTFYRSITLENGPYEKDTTPDGSVYGVFEFGILDANDPRVVATMKNIKKSLQVKTKVGGFARYAKDGYHKVSHETEKVPGNPWFICTLWYAKWLIQKSRQKKDLKEAMTLINWAAKNSLETGLFPEQIHPETAEPLSVCPLTWSHAEFVDTITNYVNKCKELSS